MKLDSAILYTNDLSRVVDYYQNVVGLKLDYLQDGSYASFKFANGVSLGIKLKKEDREVPGMQTVSIATGDADTLYAKFKNKKVVFYKDLVDQSFGKTFSILDPDDNKILFIQRK